MYTRHAVLPTLDGCTENWYKVVSIEILACLTQEKKIKSFCLFFRSSYSSLSIEMHQLHQLQCQFIFFKTCSDKESSDCFIKANQKKSLKTPNHIKFIKLCSRNGHTYLNIVDTHVLSQEDIKEIQDSPPFGCNHLRIQPGSGSSLLS